MRLVPTLLTTMGVLLISNILAAQSTGSLNGYVRDGESGLTLPGALVTIADLDRSTSADRNGRYSMAGVPPGTYTVNISYLGFDAATQLVTIAAGESTVASFTLGSQVIDLEEYQVQGIRSGQARALNQQKESINLVNIVSADAVGKLPDDNASEAVARIVGVHVNRNEGDGRYIYLRGVMPSLNLHTIDGTRVPTAEANARRRVAMDVLPSDLIGQIEVHKGLTPDLDGDTIGGVIEIKTMSPFDRDERYIGGGAEWGQQ